MNSADSRSAYTEGLRRLEGSVRTFDERVRLFQSTLAAVRDRTYVTPPSVLVAPRAANVPALTDRELRILRMMADGADNGEIAIALNFGLGTIKMHVREILSKLGTSSRTVAAVRAVRAGLI
jgi:DNA-binding NarL/FixJ family response regulator